MDDHSRYLVGWGLYAGQSGALVLEVLRRAIAAYGRPEEMLTDQGRQYKSWRGVTAVIIHILRVERGRPVTQLRMIPLDNDRGML